MRLTGTVLEVEDYSGDFRGEQGENIAYSGQRLHVLDGREVTKVKIPKQLVGRTGLGAGEAVDLRVTVSPNSGARGVYLTVGYVGPWDLPVAQAKH